MLVDYAQDIMAAVLTGFHMEKLSDRGRVATLTILLACFEHALPHLENPVKFIGFNFEYKL